MKFNKPKHHAFKRHIWLYDRGDYENFRSIINSTKWESVINPDDLDSTAKLLTEVITNAAKISIPNKLVNIRPNDVPWFKSNIRKLIRQRKRLHKKAKIINTDQSWLNFRKKKNEVTTAIRRSKKEYRDSLVSKINESSLNAKNWFKMAKSFLKLNKQTNSIPTLFNQNITNSTYSFFIYLVFFLPIRR